MKPLKVIVSRFYRAIEASTSHDPINYSLVMTIDLVSIDSRGVAFFGELGLMKDTCGQSWVNVNCALEIIYERPYILREVLPLYHT
jgi:hypothetical protein